LDSSAILERVTLPCPLLRALIPCAGAAALLLSACGSPSATVTPSSSPGASSPAANGSRAFRGTAFSTDVPSGWTDDTGDQSAVAAVSGSGTVLMLLVGPDGGHIDARNAPQPVPDDQLAQYLESVSQSGATNLSAAVPVDIDGVSGIEITYNLAASGVAFKDEDMVVNQGANTYDIVLNTPAADFTEDTAALQTVLDAWKWT
jgi:hypothetical protein